MIWLKLSNPPIKMARSKVLLRGAIAALARGEGQVDRLVHIRVFSSKSHTSSDGQGPPPVPPLHTYMGTNKKSTVRQDTVYLLYSILCSVLFVGESFTSLKTGSNGNLRKISCFAAEGEPHPSRTVEFTQNDQMAQRTAREHCEVNVR